MKYHNSTVRKTRGRPLEGPMPVGEDPAGLLRSAEQLLGHLCVAGASSRLHNLRARVVALVWEANTSAGA